MFKTILRTLSAFSIVTITASAGFAVHEADEPIIDCTDPANTYVEKCRAEAGIKPVTTDVWKDSFESVPPPVEPDTTSRTDQFVLPADSLDHYTNKQRVNLKFDANNDGTDTIVGSSIFYMNKTGEQRNFYAGIRIGADLGEPIVEAFPEVVWKTRFKAVGTRVISKRDFYINEIFDLTVKFIGTSDDTQTMGKLSGYIQQSGYYGFKIDAQFNDDGVITTGTGGITYGRFENAGAAPTETVVGNLTGIIGDRGALGAFHSDGASSDQILGFAGGFRANGFSEDELTVLRTCSLDPFHAQCNEDRFDALKYARVDLCTQGDKASVASRNTNPFECHNAVAAHNCILNPFQATCTGEGSDFNQYLDVAKDNRANFCGDSDNLGNKLCEHTTVADVCGVNPFGDICGSDYDEMRKTFTEHCLGNNNLCTNGIRDKVLERPNAAAWENTLKTREENPIVLSDVPGAGTYDENKAFLKNIEDAEDNENIEIYSYIDTYYSSLNLKTAEFSIDDTRVSLGGDEEDGMAYFLGNTVDQSNVGFYAGIFSTTDLGAPLTTPSADAPKTASWVGSFRYHSGSARDFVLEVNFVDKSIEALAVSTYLIKGDYDDNGVISGTAASNYFINNNRYKIRSTNSEHLLTGLIGKEGAVGVFRLGGFVARPADLVVDENTNKNAETFLNETCAGNPLHQFCYLRQDARKMRINECITGNAAGTSRCMEAIEYESCIYNPFDEECETSFVGHSASPDKPDYQIARENRSAFCNLSANATDNFCTGVEQAALCSYDPLNAICSNAIYDNARAAVCKSNPTSPKCVAIVTTICDATNGNIYHPSCGAGYDATRLADLTTFCGNAINITNPICVNNAQISFCSMHANAENIACAGNLPEKVTTASWLSSFYKDNGVVPQTEPDTLRRRDQFLQGTESGLNNGDAVIYTSYSTGELGSGFLNLNTSTFDGLELRGDAADGVAFFLGYNSFERVYYAGIFSGTDLGAPLVKPAKNTATWHGQFQVEDYDTSGFKTDFTLDIRFNTESTVGSVGTVEAFVHSDDIYYYLLEGKFDKNGVISGTVRYGGTPYHSRSIGYSSRTSVLTGLIGTEGAVGVFSYGGFVASSKSVADVFDPNVKFSDWVRSFGSTPILPVVQKYSPPQAQFLQGTDTGLDASYYIRNAVSQTLTLADLRTDEKIADGVAYMSGNHIFGSGSGNNAYYYAGILSGTDLGGVLEVKPANANGAIMANWKGRLGLVADGSVVAPRDIDLTIDFTNKNLTIADSNINNTHFISFVDVDGDEDTNRDGDGIKWDKHGVLDGIIKYKAASDGVDITGTVKGLIGQEGAVGVFRSNGWRVATPYAGGFVALPPPPPVESADWVSSFGNQFALLYHIQSNESQQTLFLQGRETDFYTDNLRDVVKPDNALTLASVNTDGEAADGVVYMSGTHKFGAHNTYHVAGILSGTNLGGVLKVRPAVNNVDVIFQWEGKIGMIVNGATPVERAITLDVNYTDLTINLNRTRIGQGVVSFTDVGWDNTSGVFSAAITYNPLYSSPTNIPGTVSGLIGQQGAVGAFRSNGTVATPYAGGFVARP